MKVDYMRSCKYTYKEDEESKLYKCHEEALPDSNFCIIHLPETNSSDFNKIEKEKLIKIEEKIANNDFDFIGAKLSRIDLSNVETNGEVFFSDARISEDACFNGAKIGYVNFVDAKIDSCDFRSADIGYADFSKVDIREFDFTNAETDEDAIFYKAKIKKLADFNGAIIRGNAYFGDAELGYANFVSAHISCADFSNASIDEAHFSAHVKQANFSGSEIKYAQFFYVNIEEHADFTDVKIRRNADFSEAKLKYVDFSRAEIEEDAKFYAAEIKDDINFSGAKIWGKLDLNKAKFEGDFNFEKTKCGDLPSQEEACRIAKKIKNKKGDKFKEDYYFYREMEAKRRQTHLKFSLNPILEVFNLMLNRQVKNELIKTFLKKERKIYTGYLELPIQYCFGYGVYPIRVIITFLTVVLIIALIFWLGKGVQGADTFSANLYFSAVTALTPGYGGFKPASGSYQFLATVEAIFGTFMWAAFIATFARKFMRS